MCCLLGIGGENLILASSQSYDYSAALSDLRVMTVPDAAYPTGWCRIAGEAEDRMLSRPMHAPWKLG
jgi:hypothetical protein